ncbi:antitoxin MazE-like protein [Brevundimonas sp. R86498]|uniref:antitoxin MazE-like protein n=1 Tax=Brevundimonas sp. R86498 TaxID=3093845 RepID=UPI0037C77F0B
MNVHAPKPDKYKAYRARKKAAGLKQVRIWTLDTSRPGFQEELDAAIERINASESERETLIFGEALMAEIYADDDEADAY